MWKTAHMQQKVPCQRWPQAYVSESFKGIGDYFAKLHVGVQDCQLLIKRWWGLEVHLMGGTSSGDLLNYYWVA